MNETQEQGSAHMSNVKGLARNMISIEQSVRE